MVDLFSLFTDLLPVLFLIIDKQYPLTSDRAHCSLFPINQPIISRLLMQLSNFDFLVLRLLNLWHWINLTPLLNWYTFCLTLILIFCKILLLKFDLTAKEALDIIDILLILFIVDRDEICVNNSGLGIVFLLDQIFKYLSMISQTFWGLWMLSFIFRTRWLFWNQIFLFAHFFFFCPLPPVRSSRGLINLSNVVLHLKEHLFVWIFATH